MILTSVFILLLISCTKEDTLPINNADLLGKWTWTATVGGTGNSIDKTPASTEKTVELILNQNNSYSILENNVEISSGTFELKMKKSIYKKNTEPFISYSKNEQVSDVVLTGVLRVKSTGDLSILDNKTDGIKSDFKK